MARRDLARVREHTRYAGALLLCGFYGCDVPPQVLPTLDFEGTRVGDVIVVGRDNPPLVGLGLLNDGLMRPECPGGDCGEALLSVAFPNINTTNPSMDLVNPDADPLENDSRQNTSGKLRYRMHSLLELTNPSGVQHLPFFNHGMIELPFPLFVAEGASIVSYVPLRSSEVQPWLWFVARTDTDLCHTVAGACENLRDKTFPLLGGNLMLPPAPIQSTIWLSQTRKESAFGFTYQDFNLGPLAGLAMRNDAPIVLVHVHVFVSNSGTNALRSPFGVPDTSDGRDRTVGQIQNQFDFRQVRSISETDTATGYEDVTELRAGITRDSDGRDPLAINPDGAFARCGVSLRLASINFIAQSDGFEEDVGTFYNSPTRNQWQESINPVARYVRDIVVEQATLNPNGCGSQGCQRAPPGIHVFATGTDTQLGGALALMDNVDAGQDSPVIMIDALLQHRAGGIPNTIAHELAHALGIRATTGTTTDPGECKADRFANTFLPQIMRYTCPDLPATGSIGEGGPGFVPYPDPALQSDMDTCAAIKNSAQARANRVPAGYEFWPVELYPLLLN